MNYRIFGGLLIIIALAIFGTVLYKNSQKAHEPIIYSPTFMLSALWASYKTNYIEASSGRTVDTQRNNITTSEGESYTMLRAVEADDKGTFDKSWQWTRQNLQRNDNLFSWLYGQKPDGSYGILINEGGQNTATDADTDIALALLFASQRWGDNSYADEAKKIIPAIWDEEVVEINGTPYITADNIEKTAKGQIILNPSYFAPYAYRIFAEIDTAHPWPKLIDSSYLVLNQSLLTPLDKKSTAHIPPDWVSLTLTDASLVPAITASTSTSNFGYDALRIPFRIALDYQWNQEPKARQFLDQLNFLHTEWQNNHKFVSTYGHDGTPLTDTEAPAMYGGTLGYFMIENPDAAKSMYIDKLQSLYSPDAQDWKQKLSYYDDNWAWFGMALYNGKLINYYSH